MQEAVDKLSGTFAAHASILIGYANGAKTVASIAATVGRTPFDIEEGGVLIAYESRDYIVNALLFVDDTTGLPVLPASGGIITEMATGKTYMVSAPKPNNVYESIGPLGSVLKIHTKAAGTNG